MEYRDYLQRHGQVGRGEPLDARAYWAAVERWEREYDAAWEREEWWLVEELERLLLA